MLHFVAVATLAASTLAATPANVSWQADYGKALAATRSDQQPLLVVLDDPADAKTSIEPKLLAPEGELGELLKSYRLCRVDVSTEYGKKVAEAFGATQFPHTAIIDKSGSIVLFKQPGQIDAAQWQATLAKFEKGERTSPVSQTTYFRGGTILNAQSQSLSNPAFCPSCQRKSMGL